MLPACRAIAITLAVVGQIALIGQCATIASAAEPAAPKVPVVWAVDGATAWAWIHDPALVPDHPTPPPAGTSTDLGDGTFATTVDDIGSTVISDAPVELDTRDDTRIVACTGTDGTVGYGNASIYDPAWLADELAAGRCAVAG